jgi:hypothetical protein
MKFLNNLDVNNNQLLNAKLHFLAKPTTGYVEGRAGYVSAVKRPWWMHDTAAYYLYPFDSANTANTGVLRDGSGNFSAGTITASLAGNASTATTLQTNRTFSLSGKATANGVAFNGSADVVLNVSALSVAPTEIGGTPAFGNLDLASSGAVGSSILGLANGGTNASLTASAGGVVWTNASQMQVLAGTATASKPLLSGASASPSWWACTLPAAPAGANRLLYADTTSTTTWTNSANSAVGHERERRAQFCDRHPDRRYHRG